MWEKYIVPNPKSKKTKLRTVREQKGICQDSLSDNYVVFDIETTGLSPKKDEIIEISALKIYNNQIVDRYTSLVNPGRSIEEFTTKLTGITNEMLEFSLSYKDVLPQFLSFVGDSIVLAHNANFDINFIYDKCLFHLETAFRNDFIDTLSLSRKLFPNKLKHTLQALVSEFGINESVKHRADADCLCAYKLYEYIKKYIVENNIDLSKLYSRYNYHTEIDTTNIVCDESNPLFKKVCVITGTLERMTRKNAMQLIANMGGINSENVTKETNYLILGNNDYNPFIKDGKSSKQKKAEQYILNGQDISIITESVFYDMIYEGV